MVHVDVEFCIFVDNFEYELNIWLLKSRFITKEQLAFIFSFIVIFTFWIRLWKLDVMSNFPNHFYNSTW